MFNQAEEAFFIDYTVYETQYTLENFPSTVVRGIDGLFQDISVSSSMELIHQKKVIQSYNIT